MNKFAAFAAAGVLSVSALISGQAFAENENSAFRQMMNANMYGTPASDHGTVGYGYNSGFLAKASHENTVSIRYLNELPRSERQSVITRASLDPEAIQALHAQISKSPELLRGLQEQNVNLNNVIGANSALDGSTTYIVR